MKSNSTLLKSGLTVLASLVLTLGANATVFTATTSGNFTSSTTWGGGSVPTPNLTTADQLVINAGVSVNLDTDVTINNPSASLTLNGTLSGTHSLNIQGGQLSGGLTGTLTVHNLTLGVASSASYLGSTTADNMYNSESALSVTGATHVNDTLGMYAGSTELAVGTVLTLGSNATLLMNGGTYSNAGGGTINLLGNVNLIYNGSTASTGSELSLSGVNNVSVNIGSSNQLNLNGNLTIGGMLSLSNGNLNMNGYSLILNGSMDSTGTGSLMGGSSSNLTLGGTSSNMGKIMFAAGNNTIRNLTINNTASGSSTGYANLGSDLNVAGMLTLTNGRLNLTGTSNLKLTGTDSIVGGGSSSYIATSGTGSLVLGVNGSASSSDSARMFHIGTLSTYAPVKVYNSSTTSGNFSANAHPGIYANGTSGADLSTTNSAVNTSWNVESDITTGANVSLEAYWNSSEEVNNFNRADAYLSHYTNSAWDFTTGSQATVNANGMFSVRRSGITSFSPFSVVSPNAAGISEVSGATTFSSYPNPARNVITVSVSDPKTTDNVKIYDVIGNQVAVYPIHNTTTMLDISSLTLGVYFVSVNGTTQKFVKQ